MIDPAGFPSPIVLATADPLPPKRPLLSRAGACKYLAEEHGVVRAPATLAKYACVGGGPCFYKAGRKPLYDPDELDRWVLALIGAPVSSTAELSIAPRWHKPESSQRPGSRAPDADAIRDHDARHQLPAEPT